MGILEGLLQGIIQGLTEFLPVSSSGHLSLFQHFTGNTDEGSLFFSLMLHLGTLAAVIAAYYEDLWGMLKEVGGMFGEIRRKEFHWKTENPNRRLLYMLFWGTLPLVLVVPLHKYVSRIATDGDIIIEGVCFLFTSLLLFVACKVRKGKADVTKMKPKHALTVGLMQSVATMPGISRSGSTISTGLILGFDKEFMVKYSFLLGIPAILGGAVVEVGDAIEQGFTVPFATLAVGMAAAAVVGYLCIRLVRWLVVSNKFIVFAWYTLALGIVVVVLGVLEHIFGTFNPSGAAAVAGSVLGGM